MPTVTFGPFLSRNSQAVEVPPGFKDTGFVVEFSTEDFSVNMPVIVAEHQSVESLPAFHNFLVPDASFPGTVDYLSGDRLQAGQQRFIRLECCLSALYRQWTVKRGLNDFLAEFNGELPVSAGVVTRRMEGGRGKHWLNPELQEAGFEVLQCFSYGRTVDVTIGWVLPVDRNQPMIQRCYHGLAVQFRPQPDRSLDGGRWLLPMNSTIGAVFGRQIQRLVGRKPLKCLSVEGVVETLAAYRWTKAALLTAAQLKAAKLEFIREHPGLHDDLPRLAGLMKQQGFWTDNIEPHVIVNQLRGLIQGAGASG